MTGETEIMFIVDTNFENALCYNIVKFHKYSTILEEIIDACRVLVITSWPVNKRL